MEARRQVDVEAAAERLRGVAHRTPVFTSATLDERVGASLFLKAENLQRAGAFKFRGAFNRIATLDAERRGAGVVASSSGNHAQAVALASRLIGTRATILMPADAPASKRAATIAYGAEVIEYDRYEDDRDALTVQLAEARGGTIVHAYDDPYIVSGAGTVGRELVEQAGPLDALVVCTGGGGLLAGSGLAVTERCPGARVYAVEPEASDDWRRSLEAGRRIAVEVGPTIADGQQLSTPGELNYAVAREFLAGVVTVTDAEIRSAMRFVFERMKLVCEPSGASALAALLTGKLDVAGMRVGVTLSGGNVDVQRFSEVSAG